MRKTLIRVLNSIDSDMQILGCWFHFCQAVRRKLAKLTPLFEKVKSDEKYKHIFRRFQCLPLIPLDLVQDTFKKLCIEVLKLDKELFSPFINYFHNEWMIVVTPLHFCVYLRDFRTTAAAEALNGKVNKLFRTHGSFFLFCETLQKVEASTSNDLENYMNGTQQKDSRKAFYKKRSKLIHKLQLQHKDQPKLLLNALANPKNKTLYEDRDIDMEKEDVEMITEMYGNDNGVTYKEVVDFDSDIEDQARARITSRAERAAAGKQTGTTRSRTNATTSHELDVIDEELTIEQRATQATHKTSQNRAMRARIESGNNFVEIIFFAIF